MGIKYAVSDYVLVGWQEDDLPIFGRIQYIAVLNHSTLLVVTLYNTFGITRHYHSFVVSRTAEVDAFWLGQLQDYAVFQGHQLCNGQLVITF